MRLTATIAMILLAACGDDAKQGHEDVLAEVSAPRIQCDPCHADPGCPAGARCLDYLGLGAFCGDECSDASPCPTDFVCTTVDTLAGQSVSACVHSSGMCPCTPEVAARAEPTVCVTPSDWGSCRGESSCDGHAWSPCAGPVAAPDLPNGLDDDCDGLTDENICSCGDGTCNPICGETLTSCPCDCKVKGDGICSPCGESPATAPEDCCRSSTGSSSCGDHVCMGYGCGETPATCPEDCGNACGNGVCEQGESPYTCKEDCLHKVCGNHICESTDGGPDACPQDCAPFCGNCVCEPERDESQFNCPIDCGYCGDRECSRCADLKETAETCPEDCCELGATCLVAGSCNIGRYSCDDSDTCELTAELWPRGVECGPATCEGNALRLQARCDDQGACQPGLLYPCLGYVCRADACVTTCSGASDCAPGFSCQDDTCTRVDPDAPRVIGEACDDGAECASQHCEDQICCESSCQGTCMSCTVPGHVGACWPIAADADPDDECAPSAPCGTTGACDGAGHCQLSASGSACGAGASCVDGMRAASFACDGDGACVGADAEPCPDHFGCATAASCRTSCTRESDCASGNVCNPATHACEAPVARGDDCDFDTQCLGGHCAAGVCCATTCTGLCQSCAVEGHRGTCFVVPAGTDPGEQCEPEAEAPCGRTGACDGAGQCALAPLGTSCGGDVCSDASYTPPWRCDGAGSCVMPSATACPSHLACGASGCLTSCAGDDDCVDDWICNGDHQCEPLRDDGDGCSNDAQCAHGHCEDHTCCGEVCESECMSCRVPGNVGTCMLVPEGLDPNDDCEPLNGDTCGPTGTCDGAGRCADAAATTSCALPGCQDGFLATAFQCDGEGQCLGVSPVACPDHLGCRDASQCATSCAMDDDCVGGWVCNTATGMCAEPGQDGSPCGENGDCASDHCVEQICCQASCAGPCKKCDGAGDCTLLDRQQTAECMDAFWCVAGACVPQGQANGTPCTLDSQCQSGACSDAVCCDINCDGAACADCSGTFFGTVRGTCSLLTGTADPDCIAYIASRPCNDSDGNCTALCDDASQCTSISGVSHTPSCLVDSQCLPSQWCSGFGSCEQDGASGASCVRSAACASNMCMFGAGPVGKCQ